MISKCKTVWLNHSERFYRSVVVATLGVMLVPFSQPALAHLHTLLREKWSILGTRRYHQLLAQTLAVKTDFSSFDEVLLHFFQRKSLFPHQRFMLNSHR